MNGSRLSKKRLVDKLIWLISEIVSHFEDLKEEILRLDMITTVIKCSDTCLTPSINCMSAMCISNLSIYEDVIDKMIEHNSIDLTLKLCQDNTQDIRIKEYASNAIGHFALHKEKFAILMNKNIIDLFDVFCDQLRSNID